MRDAGVYHLATGTWTRGRSRTAALGADVIYRNDAWTGYFGNGLEGIFAVDEGMLPGPSSEQPHGAGSGGPQDAYLIDSFEFAYCAETNAGGIDWELRFYDAFRVCDNPDDPDHCMHQANPTILLPALPTSGACWTVTVDLSGGSEFCMQADGAPCAPGWQTHGFAFDFFGFGFLYDNGGSPAGPMFAGNPPYAPEGDGTCYSPSFVCGTTATGLGQHDLLTLGDPWGGSCIWSPGFPGIGCGIPPPAPEFQLHLLLGTDCSTPCLPPCVDERTCYPAVPNSTGHPGLIAITTCSLAADEILVTAGDLPHHQAGYLLIGNGSGVISNPPGAAGDLCLAGSTPGIGRYTADVGVTGSLGLLATDLIGGAVGGGAGHLPNPPGGQLQPGQVWGFQYWYRDVGTSNFTDVIRVAFTP